jgi:hypothetical protein
LAVVAAHEFERHSVEIVTGVVLLLPAIGGEELAEVAAAVEESDADEGDSEVAGGLEVVTGEDAEATGIDGETLVEPEFSAEVGDAAVFALGGEGAVEPGGGFDVLLQVFAADVEFGEEDFVFDEVLLALGREPVDEFDGVVFELFPEFSIDFAEKGLGVVIPSPAEVVSQFAQGQELRRKIPNNFK